MYKSKQNIAIRIFFLVLFLSYFTGTNFFGHTHIVNGAIIVHSHYFNGSSPQKEKSTNHEHKESTLILIANATSWQATLMQTPEIPDSISCRIFIYHTEKKESVTSTTPTTDYLRGPPAHQC